jgi:hypothetical protein
MYMRLIAKEGFRESVQIFRAFSHACRYILVTLIVKNTLDGN